MVRGLIAGLASGVVVAAVGFGALSVLLPPPAVKRSEAQAQLAESPSDLKKTDTDAHADAGAVTAGQTAAVAPAVVQPSAPVLAPMPAPMPVPAAGPALAVPQGDLTAPPAPQPDGALVRNHVAPLEAAAPQAPTLPAVADAAAAQPAAKPAPVAVPELAPVPLGGSAPPSAPQPETAMPVPPPGEAVSPALAPAPTSKPAAGEIVLMPDGSIVPPDRQLPAEPDAAVAPALQRFAAHFQRRGLAPLVSVILVDVGVPLGGLDPTTIRTLGFPVTVALDPSRPGAAEDAAIFRAAGIEVATLGTGLPPGAPTAEARTAISDWQQRLPESLAVIEPAGAGFQDDAALSGQVVAALKATGGALVTRPGAAEGAARIAQAQSVPIVPLWRVPDRDREGAAAITRALKQAETEAAREGSVALMLSAWPESVAALSDWAGRIRGRVALAPLSALTR